jgi:hypothetical protein
VFLQKVASWVDAISAWVEPGPQPNEGARDMYIGIGTLVVVLLIVAIVYFARRA